MQSMSELEHQAKKELEKEKEESVKRYIKRRLLKLEEKREAMSRLEEEYVTLMGLSVDEIFKRFCRD